MSEAVLEARLEAAQAGDQQAFSDLVEPYRPELLVHCYRVLGSLQDAEDMVQETFLRAWKRLDSFNGGPYFRAWLYKIATNLCLDLLDKRSRRVLAPAAFPVADPHAAIAAPIREPIWLEPLPDELVPEAATLGPEGRYTQRESISLAFLAALQRLPARQRVVLILGDVLDWRAAEIARLLELTAASVNGLLRRARATMRQNYLQNQPAPRLDRAVQGVLSRYVEAWETGDVEALIALLADRVVFSMPPSPTWFSGREAVRAHAQRMFSDQAPRRWRLQPTRANRQAAFVCYRRDDSSGQYAPHFLQVLTLAGDQITEIHAFYLPLMLPRFSPIYKRSV